MTVENSNNKTVLIANGVLLSFAFTFKVFAAGEIAVYVDGVLVTSGYTVTGLGQDAGGNVVFVSAPADQAEITMIRNIDYTQEADFVVGGPFNPDTLERQLDRQTMMIQRQQEEISRGLYIPIGSDSSTVVDPVKIEAVADNIDNVNSVADNEANINAVVLNEANINQVAQDLPAIQAIAGTLTMTNTNLELNLGSVEVPGFTYTTLTAAIAYAKTVLQSGGYLKISIEASTTITEPSLVLIEHLPFTLEIEGVSQSTSILTVPTSLTIDGIGKAVEVDRFTLNVPILNIKKSGFVEIDELTLNGELKVENCDFLEIKNANTAITGTFEALDIVNTPFDISAGVSFEVTATTASVVKATGRGSGGQINGVNMIHPVGSVSVTSFTALSGALYEATNITFDGNETTQFSPPADTYGSFLARILTTP